MRILYFHQHFSTPKGAAGIRSYQMARAAIRAGHRVTMVCGRYANGQTDLTGNFVNGVRRGSVDEIEIIEIDVPYSNTDSFLRRCWKFAQFLWRSIGFVFSERYDLVFATTTPLTVGIPGIIARWVRQKPFVFEVRDLWPELPKAMGVLRNPLLIHTLSALEWLSYRSANRVIALSPGIVEGIRRRGVRPGRITLIPNGCDLDIFGLRRRPWRPDGIAATDLLVVFAGTHGIANGLDAVLDTAAVLQRQGRTDIKFVLIGEGMMKARLQDRTVSEALQNVIFLAPLGKERLADLLAGADVGLQTLENVPAFYYGTSPNKFFDYLAAGLPVLTNYPGWVADLVKSKKCGFAVPPEQPQQFAQALIQAAQDRAELNRMATNSRALAERAFDRNKLAAAWVDWVAR